MLDLDKLQALTTRANDHACDIARGRARWTMRIPADLENDSDLLITSALSQVDELISEVRELRTQRDAVLKLCDESDASDFPEVRGDLYADMVREALGVVPGPSPDAAVDGPVAVSEPTAGSGVGADGPEGPETATGLSDADRLARDIVDAAKALWCAEGAEDPQQQKAHHALMATVADLYRFETTGGLP